MCWLIFSILEGGVMKKYVMCDFHVFMYRGIFTSSGFKCWKDVPTKWEGWGSRIFIRGVGDHSDNIYIGKYCLSENHTQMRLNICDDNGEMIVLLLGLMLVVIFGKEYFIFITMVKLE